MSATEPLLYVFFTHLRFYSQIQVDLPRTNPDMPFFQQKEIQRAMERVLYIWSIRHPASSYVQGMNDLLCPLLLVAMYPYAQDVLRCDCATLNPQV
jgi:TBC1 domain family member 2